MDRKERNNIAKSILESHNREEVRKILNTYTPWTGLSFTSGDFSVPSVSGNISTSWLNNNNELWDAFSKTKYSKFFYDLNGEADEQPYQQVDNPDIMAWSWDKTNPDKVEKTEQMLELDSKTIETGYIYKRQSITQEDLDDLRDSGEYDEFLSWTTFELRRQVEDEIVGCILGGPIYDQYDAESLPIHFDTFAPHDVGSGNFFTTRVNQGPGLTTIRDASLSVIRRGSKWLVVHPSIYFDLTDEFGPGVNDYNLCSLLDVDYIYKTPLIPNDRAIVLDPSSYTIKIKNALSVAYPAYQKNNINLQYELNCGGIIRYPYSSALVYEDL